MTDSSHLRPRRVVIVNAEDPLAEVTGEFFWREDHDQIVSDACDRAYCDGYAAGWEAAMARLETPPLLVVPTRKSRLGRAQRWSLSVLLLLGTLWVIVAVVLEGGGG